MNRGPAESSRFVPIVEALLGGGQSVRFQAAGGSMHPTIRNGEIIIVAPLGRSPVRAGDVVLYRSGRAAIAHRVMRLHEGGGRPVQVVLRGDAACCSDRPVELAHVLGRVTAVERGTETRALDSVGPLWSRVIAHSVRLVCHFRMRATEIVIGRPTT